QGGPVRRGTGGDGSRWTSRGELGRSQAAPPGRAPWQRAAGAAARIPGEYQSNTCPARRRRPATVTAALQLTCGRTRRRPRVGGEALAPRRRQLRRQGPQLEPHDREPVAGRVAPLVGDDQLGERRGRARLGDDLAPFAPGPLRAPEREHDVAEVVSPPARR